MSLGHRASIAPYLIAITAALGLTATVPAASSDVPQGLSARAESLLVARDLGAEGPAGLEVLRNQLLAVSDTLEMAGLDSLAALTIDRAGVFSYRLGELDEARRLWTRGLDVARRSGDLRVEVVLLNSLGVGYAISGDLESAAELFRDQAHIRHEVGDAREEAISWGNLAHALSILGRVPEAVEAVKRATVLNREADNPQGRVSNYTVLIDLLNQMGQIEAAYVAADSAVAISRRYEMYEMLGVSLTKRGSILLNQGEYEAALVDFDAGLEAQVAEGHLYHAPAAELVRGFPLLMLGRAEECLALVEAPRYDWEGTVPVNFRFERAFLRGNAVLQLGRTEEAARVLEAAVDSFNVYRGRQTDVRSQIGLFATGGGELYASLAQCRLAQGDTLAAWRTVDQGRAAVLEQQLGAGAESNDVDLSNLRVRLATTGGVLIEFAEDWLDPLTVFGVGPATVRSRGIVNRAQLQRDARAALDLMSTGADNGACAGPLTRVAERLMPALDPLIPPGAARLYIVPPHVLAGFPFEALPTGNSEDPGETLGERYAITYLPSAAALGLLWDRETAPEGMIAFADPALEDGLDAAVSPTGAARRTLGALPYAREEVRAIAPRGATVLVGPEATAAVARDSMMGEMAVIHFATHAEINSLHGERSALLLAGDDPNLTAAEIEGMSWNADIVTLSGCHTSGGFTHLGEGTFGLARALLIAGTRSVVTSLWDVDDRSAKQFMVSFYGHLRDGRPRDESLRLTRREMRERGFGHRDRSGFVLTGLGHAPIDAFVSPRSVGRKPVLPILIGLGMGAVVLLITFRLIRSRSV